MSVLAKECPHDAIGAELMNQLLFYPLTHFYTFSHDPSEFMLDKMQRMMYNKLAIAWARNGFDGGFAIR